MKKHFYSTFLAILVIGGGVLSAETVTPAKERAVNVIDIPTADVVDHYGYNVSFRFGKDGGLQTKTAFGVFPRLNLGFGLDGERVIGTENGRLNKPSINVKFRVFDGKGVLPAIALGFDGQGYVYNKPLGEYEQKEKGFYLVTSKEIFWPDFMLHLGANKFDFDKGNTNRAFGGISYTYEHTVGFMFEYDHATVFKERRINYGLKYYVTPSFTVDAIGRYVPKSIGVSAHETERVLRLAYTGAF